MTEALRDHDEQAGDESLEQVETDARRALKVEAPDRTPIRPIKSVGMPAAEAELLGEYNLYNG